MMKKVVLLTLTVICALQVIAQTDSLKKPAAKPIPLKTVNVQMSRTDNVFDNLSKSKEYSTFVTLITAAGLTETLKSKSSSFTVFAPANGAYQQLSAGALDTLMKTGHLAELTKDLNYCIIAGKLTSKDIARQINLNHGEATLTTLSGNVLKAKINNNRNIVLTDENGTEAIISRFDIVQSNGILNIVDAVLMPRPTN